MITVRHLLTMTSGICWNGGVHYHCPMMRQLRDSGDWISHIADRAVADVPGTKYNYKEWDVILLAKLLDKACGDMFDFMDENLFRPWGSRVRAGIRVRAACTTVWETVRTMTTRRSSH